ncbi:hypothetical protein AVEN_43016-1 [Araneus ventricosus]|uniref:Uncharacterized protein n=1 Tax=Araneus ventricosus TaxID=182803 RepID=A0A4Y2VSI2_ARAVE|nr:hypothetical protein AVEN_43016-1 [Araneus ventricosus]
MSSRLEFQLTALEDPGNPFTKVPPRSLLHPAHKSIPISLEENWFTDKTEFQTFTDGSKTDKGTASAFCVFCHGFIHHNSEWCSLAKNGSCAVNPK